jgi:hypothetical protein
VTRLRISNIPFIYILKDEGGNHGTIINKEDHDFCCCWNWLLPSPSVANKAIMATSHYYSLVALVVVPHSKIIIWLASSLLEYTPQGTVIIGGPGPIPVRSNMFVPEDGGNWVNFR